MNVRQSAEGERGQGSGNLALSVYQDATTRLDGLDNPLPLLVYVDGVKRIEGSYDCSKQYPVRFSLQLLSGLHTVRVEVPGRARCEIGVMVVVDDPVRANVRFDWGHYDFVHQVQSPPDPRIEYTVSN